MRLITETMKTGELVIYDPIYISDLEKHWRSSLVNYSDSGLLELFPDVKGVFSPKLKELEVRREQITESAKAALNSIKVTIKDDFSIWFWREYVKHTFVQELIKIDRQISRFKYLLALSNGKIKSGQLDRKTIAQAAETPIENIVSQHVKLRKSGKTLSGKCPFHQDNTPSFFIYLQTNSFYCYGCQKGGDVIRYVELSQNVGFVESVKYLIGGR